MARSSRALHRARAKLDPGTLHREQEAGAPVDQLRAREHQVAGRPAAEHPGETAHGERGDQFVRIGLPAGEQRHEQPRRLLVPGREVRSEQHPPPAGILGQRPDDRGHAGAHPVARGGTGCVDGRRGGPGDPVDHLVVDGGGERVAVGEALVEVAPGQPGGPAGSADRELRAGRAEQVEPGLHQPGPPVRPAPVPVEAAVDRAFEDTWGLLTGRPGTWLPDHVYRECVVLGSTLQVRPEQWPAHRAAFEEYWTAGLAQVPIDDEMRCHFGRLLDREYLGRPGRIGRERSRWLTTGFLHEPFRSMLDLPWSDADRREFESRLRRTGDRLFRLPPTLRRLPYNAFLADLRLRRRIGRPLV
ncbi:oxygenase MpaB family protein [Pseudonocardia sp. NPDC046786]|uniref:oxygenase MpaB family protein n=1 Tax=Pseudonocardia sp. NPDC046786 TaxID=3155471 RepID=UPI0033E77EA1